MNDSTPEAYKDLKRRMQTIQEFIRNEKRAFINKETQRKLYETTNIQIFVEPLK